MASASGIPGGLAAFLGRRLEGAWGAVGPERAAVLVRALEERCRRGPADGAELAALAHRLGLALAQELQESHPGWALEGSLEEVISELTQLEARKTAAVKAFETLRDIHESLLVNQAAIPTAEELKAYSEAAKVVGSKEWSKDVVAWVQEEFCKEDASALHSRARLLDVGSSYGAYLGIPHVDCIALDLAPAHPDVFEADFFQVSILEDLDAEVRAEGRRLRALGARSFDAVVLSLVLSFLPTPALRREMLDRARRCLRPAGSLFVVEKAALAAPGPAGLAQRQAFQEGLEAAGFEARRYAALGRLAGGRRPHAHAWRLAPCAAPRPHGGPELRTDRPGSA